MTPRRAPAFRHDDAGTPESVWASEPLLERADPLRLDCFDNLVVVAAHPDDETLTAGGLIAAASSRGIRVDVVVATAGEASHPASPTHGPDDLCGIRDREVREAVGTLDPSARVHSLDLGDGRLRESVHQLVAALVDVIGQTAGRTLVVSTCRTDGHTDHEAAGQAAAAAAWRTDATHLEAPLWLWHWGTPEDLSALVGDRALLRLDLDAAAMAAKRSAMVAHASQTTPLGSEPGNEVLLPPQVTSHFERPFEIFVSPRHDAESPFDELHRLSGDPWRTRSSWYERRKRDLTVASLPVPRYGTVLELGCSVGTLARDLLERCEKVVAVDESAKALERARRVSDSPDIDWVQASVPEDWERVAERAPFDAVILSEVGYFLSPDRLARLAECIADSGAHTVVACHWVHPVVGWPLTAREVHRILDERMVVPRTVTLTDPDFDLAVWSTTSSWGGGPDGA